MLLTFAPVAYLTAIHLYGVLALAESDTPLRSKEPVPEYSRASDPRDREQVPTIEMLPMYPVLERFGEELG
jgi:hypothetical protein